MPIVFGGADYRELLPPGSFINALDFPSPKGGCPCKRGIKKANTLPLTEWSKTYVPTELSTLLFSLLNQPHLFASYFTWRPNYSVRIRNHHYQINHYPHQHPFEHSWGDQTTRSVRIRKTHHCHHLKLLCSINVMIMSNGPNRGDQTTR